LFATDLLHFCSRLRFPEAPSKAEQVVCSDLLGLSAKIST